MEEKEALEMLKCLKFNWTINFNKMSAMCDYFFNLQQQNKQLQAKIDKAIEYLKNKNNFCITDKLGAGSIASNVNVQEIQQILKEGNE